MDISSLPYDMKNIISSFFDDRSRRIMRSTSTEWFNIINYDQFTVFFARVSTLPEIVSVFQRYTKPIGLRFEKTALSTSDSHLTLLASLANLTSLEVEPFRYLENRPRDESFLDPAPFTALTALQKLYIDSTNFTPYLLNHFPNLTHVRINNVYEFLLGLNGFITPKPINVVAKLRDHTRIRTLDINDDKDILLFNGESVSKMSNLSKLSITCQNSLFPFSQLPNLESLHIFSNLFDDFSACTRLTWLKITSLANDDEVTHNKLKQISTITQLRHLELRVSARDGKYGYLSTLTNLEHLDVQEQGYGQLTGDFLEFVHSSKLTNISTAGVKDLCLLTKFTNLHEIDIKYEYSKYEYSTSVVSLQLPNVTKLTTSEISFVSHCPNLRSLTLFGSHNFAAYKVISSLIDLEILTLLKIDNATLQLVGNLTKMKTLSAIFLPDIEYDFHGLQQLTALKELHLKSLIREASIKHRELWPSLSTLTNLESLTLFCIPDDEGVKILESLPFLKRLRVSDAKVLNFDEGKLSNLSNLQTLLLNGNTFGQSRPHECKLTHLPYLYECLFS